MGSLKMGCDLGAIRHPTAILKIVEMVFSLIAMIVDVSSPDARKLLYEHSPESVLFVAAGGLILGFVTSALLLIFILMGNKRNLYYELCSETIACLLLLASGSAGIHHFIGSESSGL